MRLTVMRVFNYHNNHDTYDNDNKYNSKNNNINNNDIKRRLKCERKWGRMSNDDDYFLTCVFVVPNEAFSAKNNLWKYYYLRVTIISDIFSLLCQAASLTSGTMR